MLHVTKRLLVLLLLSLLLCACSSDVPQPTVNDDVDGTRIIALAPHLTEIMFAAGAGKSLVGAVRYSDYPPAANQIPLIGDAFRVDYEQIVKLSPDIVLSWAGGTPNEITQYLSGLGFRIVEFESQRLLDIPRHVEELGKLADTSLVAGKIANQMQQQIISLQKKFADRPKVSVFLQISADPWFTVTRQHILNDAIETCGGENVFSHLAGVAPVVSFESIVKADPDAIIVVTVSADGDWQEEWRPWEKMAAVRHQRIYPVNTDLLSRAGPRMIMGAVQICAALESARAGLAVRTIPVTAVP